LREYFYRLIAAVMVYPAVKTGIVWHKDI
jgi:hypothetical protein